MSYNSKYTGLQVENLLDQVANGNTGGGGEGGVSVEIDPIFSASPAAKITDDNISSWNNKVDKVNGKQLSTEDFTTLLKQKLDGLSNYDDMEIQLAVYKLRTDFDTLVSGDTTTAIKTFNEIIAFLDGISDTEDLSGIIASIEQQIAAKQEKLVSGTNIKTINGESVLGEGDLKIGTDNGNLSYPIVEIEPFGVHTINPNTYYMTMQSLGSSSTIEFRLGEKSAEYADEYIAEFGVSVDIDGSGPIIILPDNISWVKAPDFSKSGTYIISIINGVGLWIYVNN